MLKKGLHSTTPYFRGGDEYNLFNIEIVIGQYNKENLEFDLLVSQITMIFDDFTNAFKFIEIEDIKSASNEESKEIKIITNVSQNKYSVYIPTKNNLEHLLSQDDLGEYLCVYDVRLKYLDTEEKIQTIGNYCGGAIILDNRNNEVVFTFSWDFGADWFFNEYKDSNTSLLQNALYNLGSLYNYQIEYNLKNFSFS